MIERQKISERERQRRTWQRAMTVPDFCQRYRIGRTKTYAEINAGRLRARKAGRRTIIAEEDAEEWLNNLPALHGGFDEGGS
jgi:excisionase family DNA binding protein